MLLAVANDEFYLRSQLLSQAQFLFNSFGGLDLYTVILDYANMPVLVQPSIAAIGRFCQSGGCKADLRDHCPTNGGSWGTLASCLSAKAPVRYTVSVRLSTLVKQSQTVWQGMFAILVQVYKDVAHCQDASLYSNHTKRTCPTCTAYVIDNDALLACGGDPDYTITFCGLL